MYDIADFLSDWNGVLDDYRVNSQASIDVNHLSRLEGRALKGGYVDIEELRDVLRRAAALLCRTTHDQCSIVQYLVGVPFATFTKQSIKLGIALWLGVINESPQMEPRILAEIALSWEITVRRKQGVFSDKLRYVRGLQEQWPVPDSLQSFRPILCQGRICSLG